MMQTYLSEEAQTSRIERIKSGKDANLSAGGSQNIKNG